MSRYEKFQLDLHKLLESGKFKVSYYYVDDVERAVISWPQETLSEFMSNIDKFCKSKSDHKYDLRKFVKKNIMEDSIVRLTIYTDLMYCKLVLNLNYVPTFVSEDDVKEYIVTELKCVSDHVYVYDPFVEFKPPESSDDIQSILRPIYNKPYFTKSACASYGISTRSQHDKLFIVIRMDEIYRDYVRDEYKTDFRMA